MTRLDAAEYDQRRADGDADQADRIAGGTVGHANATAEGTAMITAKVRVANKVESEVSVWNAETQQSEPARQAQVSFYADYADGRNKEWASATPTLNLSMTLNGAAADLFEQGKAYTLQFVENDD